MGTLTAEDVTRLSELLETYTKARDVVMNMDGKDWTNEDGHLKPEKRKDFDRVIDDQDRSYDEVAGAAVNLLPELLEELSRLQKLVDNSTSGYDASDKETS